MKLEIFKTTYGNEPIPQIALRDENHNLIAECGAHNRENLKTAREIVRRFNSAEELAELIRKLREALRNMLDGYNGCTCGCDPDDAWHEAARVLAETEQK